MTAAEAMNTLEQIRKETVGLLEFFSQRKHMQTADVERERCEQRISAIDKALDALLRGAEQ